MKIRKKQKNILTSKKQLANKYPNDIIAYTNGKSKLIEEILKSANIRRKANDKNKVIKTPSTSRRGQTWQHN